MEIMIHRAMVCQTERGRRPDGCIKQISALGNQYKTVLAINRIRMTIRMAHPSIDFRRSRIRAFYKTRCLRSANTPVCLAMEISTK